MKLSWELNANVPQIPSCPQTMSPVHFKSPPSLSDLDTSPSPHCPHQGVRLPLLLHCTPLLAFSYSHRSHPESKHHFLERNFILFPEKATDVNHIKKKHKKQSIVSSSRTLKSHLYWLICFMMIGSFQSYSCRSTECTL